jgi:hypothetical protein
LDRLLEDKAEGKLTKKVNKFYFYFSNEIGKKNL